MRRASIKHACGIVIVGAILFLFAFANLVPDRPLIGISVLGRTNGLVAIAVTNRSGSKYSVLGIAETLEGNTWNFATDSEPAPEGWTAPAFLSSGQGFDLPPGAGRILRVPVPANVDRWRVTVFTRRESGPVQRSVARISGMLGIKYLSTEPVARHFEMEH